MQTIPFLKSDKKHYLSLFRWLCFLSIIIYHSLYLYTTDGWLFSFGNKVYNYIPFLVDCFFVISGFLLARSFHLNQLPTHFYLKKRLLELLPTLILFWLCFLGIGSLGWMDVNLIDGFKDVLGLSVFGVPLRHNQLNYTWFLYVLFWCNILFYGLLGLKKLAPFIILGIVLFAGITISFYWIEGNVISPKPYDLLPISFGLFRGLYATATGVLCGYLSTHLPKHLYHNKDLSYILNIYEVIILMLSILMLSQLTHKHFYVNTIPLFGLLLFSLSLEKSVLYKILNIKYFSFGDGFLFGGYIFSAIVLAGMSHFLAQHPSLTNYGDTIYLLVILGSLCCGAVTYYMTKKLKKYF